jgi:hypothetical protein
MKYIAVLSFLFLFVSGSYGQVKPPTETAMDRFLRYSKIDTQSAEDKDVVPSTQKQFDLAEAAWKRN